MGLTNTLVRSYTHFHGWRIFAEEYLDVTLDELLAVVRPPEVADSPLDPFANPPEVTEIDEYFCGNILSLNEDYLETYQSIREEYTNWAGLETPDGPPLDLDDRAEAFAQAIVEVGVERYRGDSAMKRLTDLQYNVENLQDTVLSDFDPTSGCYSF